MESNADSHPGRTRREGFRNSGKRSRPHKMDNCDRCRNLKQKCEPESRDWSRGEKCYRCNKANEPCSAPTVKRRRLSRSRSDATRARARAASSNTETAPTTIFSSTAREEDLSLATPSISTSAFPRPVVPAQCPTPRSRPSCSRTAFEENAESSSTRDPVGGFRRPQVANSIALGLVDRPASPPRPAETSEDQCIDRLAEILTVLESTDSQSDAIGRQDKLDCDVGPTREEIKLLSWSLARRAKWELEEILRLIPTTICDGKNFENPEAELWCSRTLQVIWSYDNTRHNFAWMCQSEATLLRKLVSIYQLRGLRAEIYRISRRISRIPGIALSSKEQKLLVQAYKETFPHTKSLLKYYQILPDDDSKTFQSDHPFPAVHRAIEDGQVEVVHSLLRETTSTALPLDIIKRHALHVAASAPLEMLQCVLEHMRNADHRDLFQRTPLFYAARDGSLENFQALVHVGANMEDRDMFSHSLLATAAGSGKVDIVEYLLQNGIDPNHQPLGRMTPLMKAAEAGHLSVVRLLLACKARPDETLASGKNAAAIAKEKGNIDCSLVITSYYPSNTSSVDQPFMGNTAQASSQETVSLQRLPTQYLDENDQRSFLTDSTIPSAAQMPPSEFDFQLPAGAWSESQILEPVRLVNNPPHWPNYFSQC